MPRPRIRLITLAAAVSIFMGGHTARAGEFFEQNGTAIRGYDPVAYFTDRQPMKGSADFSTTHKGAVFHFSTAEHQNTFMADPDKYVPQYGGFCAYGMAKGYKASTDPAAFTVYQGKLYLNYSLSVRELWSEDIPSHIQKAEHNWPHISQSPKVIQ